MIPALPPVYAIARVETPEEIQRSRLVASLSYANAVRERLNKHEVVPAGEVDAAFCAVAEVGIFNRRHPEIAITSEAFI